MRNATTALPASTDLHTNTPTRTSKDPSASEARPVVLVDLYWTRDKDPRIPLGHASILTALRSAGVPVRSVVRAVNADNAAEQLAPARLARELIEEAAEMGSATDIAIGAYAWAEHIIQPLLPELRERGFEGRIILGGPQISYASAGIASTYPEADVFIRGYGEQALVELLSTPGAPVIAGVCHAGTVDLALQANVDLEDLPSPWLSGTIPVQGQKFIRWETQRGCAFRCAFCQHREAGSRLKKRALDLDRVKAEIDLFCEAGVEDIAVLDPIFNISPHAIAVLQRFAEKGFTGRLSLQCRAEAIKEDFLEAAAALNVRLEFGLQTTNDAEGRAVDRRNRIEKVHRALERTREYGFNHEVSLIFGLPLQTLESFERSVRWCLEQEVPVIKAFPLILLRGTRLERERDTWGLVDCGGAMPMVVRSSTFTEEEWRAMACLSEALRRTEGQHPCFEELRALADTLEPNELRWIPTKLRDQAVL